MKLLAGDELKGVMAVRAAKLLSQTSAAYDASVTRLVSLELCQAYLMGANDALTDEIQRIIEKATEVRSKNPDTLATRVADTDQSSQPHRPR